MEREVRYCTTSDGVRIAYCVEGEGSPYLLCSEPTVSHVQLETSRPVLGPALGEIARHNRLIRFDMRGTGLSDRVLPRTLDEATLDIEAVVERTCPQEFALGCIQLVTPAAIAFAARHPDRITRMVIFDGYANTKDLFMTPQVQALVAAAQMDWGIATEAIGSMVFGAGRDETRDWGAYIRLCVAPETFAADYVRIFSMFDSSDLAPRITAPTLILRHDGLQFITMDMAKDLAARIPNAQLVVVPGTWVTEP